MTINEELEQQIRAKVLYGTAVNKAKNYDTDVNYLFKQLQEARDAIEELSSRHEGISEFAKLKLLREEIALSLLKSGYCFGPTA